MQKMLAKRDFPYRGRSLKVGDVFDAEDEHVMVFTLIGHARLAESEDQSYQTRVLEADIPKRKRGRPRKAILQ